jgi:hypothetical protein
MLFAGLYRLVRSGVPIGAAAILGALLVCPNAARAGPPFRTDDPVPVEPGHWEIFTFSTATHAAGDTSGILSGIDANYGAAPNLQLHATFPAAFDKADHGNMAVGYGDTEFLAEDEAGWRPQAAIYPALDLPTGNAARNLGAGHTRVFLPVWLQKGFGRWTTFAGAGYWINPGSGNRDFWYFGWAVQRQIADNLAVGGELFHQTANTLNGKDQTGFNLGIVYDLSEHYHLMFSAGQGIRNRTTTNQFTYYTSLQVTF